MMVELSILKIYTNMHKIITEIVLVNEHDKDPQIFSEGGIKIRVDDEGGGRFLIISGISKGDKVSLEKDDLDDFYLVCKELLSQGDNNEA
jgi:hypothetical protein